MNNEHDGGNGEVRKWTAVIEARANGQTVEFEAAQSEHDLVKDQTEAAVREASVLLDEQTYVNVVLYKTLVDGVSKRDRSFTLFRDRKGTLRYDGPYA